MSLKVLIDDNGNNWSLLNRYYVLVILLKALHVLV